MTLSERITGFPGFLDQAGDAGGDQVKRKYALPKKNNSQMADERYGPLAKRRSKADRREDGVANKVEGTQRQS